MDKIEVMRPPDSTSRPSSNNSWNRKNRGFDILKYDEHFQQEIIHDNNIDIHNNDKSNENDYNRTYLERLRALVSSNEGKRNKQYLQTKQENDNMNDNNNYDTKTALKLQIKRLSQATTRMNEILKRTKEAKKLIAEHIKSHTEPNVLPYPLRSGNIDKSVLNTPLLSRQPYTLLISAHSNARPSRGRSSRKIDDQISVRSSSANSSKSRSSTGSYNNVYRNYTAPVRPASATTRNKIKQVLKRPSEGFEKTRQRKEEVRPSSPKRIVIKRENLENSIIQYLMKEDNIGTPILIEDLKLKNLKSELSPTSYQIMRNSVLKKNRNLYGISPSLRKSNEKIYKYSDQFDNQYKNWKTNIEKNQL